MSKFLSTTRPSASPNSTLRTLQDLLQSFTYSQELSLTTVSSIFDFEKEAILSVQEGSLFNQRLVSQQAEKIVREEPALGLISQQNGGEPVTLLVTQRESAATVAAINELAVQGQQTTLVVTTLMDENDGGVGGTGLSLREAISIASDGDTIIFSQNLNDGTTTDGVITLSLGELVINKSLTIDGDLDDDDSTRDITVDADGMSRVFNIDGRKSQ